MPSTFSFSAFLTSEQSFTFHSHPGHLILYLYSISRGLPRREGEAAAGRAPAAEAAARGPPPGDLDGGHRAERDAETAQALIFCDCFMKNSAKIGSLSVVSAPIFAAR